jgi:hypothetical protein
MAKKDDFLWLMLESYLSTVVELTTPRSPENIKKRNDLQLFIAFLLLGKQNPKSVDPLTFRNIFVKVAKAFPVAEKNMGGEDAVLQDISIPPLDIKQLGAIPDVWNTIPDEQKSKVYGLYVNVKNIIGEA